MLGDRRFIETLRLQNLLSFGPDTPPIRLGSLNVLIGPNGSGKSNFLEAVDLLKASATDLVAPIRLGGGTDEWLWKGVKDIPVAEIEAIVTYSDGPFPLNHKISFTSVGQSFELIDETLEDEPTDSASKRNNRYYFRYGKGRPILTRSAEEEIEGEGGGAKKFVRVRPKEFDLNQSVLSQRRSSESYPEITYLGSSYRRLKFYREWNLGRNTPPRLPQKVDLPNDFLAEDASNLALVLNDLNQQREAKNELVGRLTQLYEQFEMFSTYLHGGTVQVFFQERNLLDPIPATRLSDGTLRFLCLASILCHPMPPPLICLEEPEIGLHPDILPTIAEMLIEASNRTQVVVTTHSDTLVDALSHVPEAVLVCEKESNATTVSRLDQDALHKWLKDYSLGELWRSGELGGNRW